MLGEAVLGHCPSAEKIDLTRFWNWQDSPGDTAPQIAPSTLPTTTPSLATGETGPNNLTNLPSLINNVLTAPNPDTSLLQALGTDAANQKPFSTSLTGAEQLANLLNTGQTTANSARSDALKTTKELQAQAMATVGNIVGGIYGGNPNAGSSALAAESGKAPKEEGAAKAKGTEKGKEATKEKGKGTTGQEKGGETTKGEGGKGTEKAKETEGAKGGEGVAAGGEALGGGAVSGAPGPPPGLRPTNGNGRAR